MMDATVSSDADELQFEPEDDAGTQDSGPRWKVLIVDDDPEVHSATRFALKDFDFAGRGLAFTSALSAAEGIRALEREPDTALILLDVVMENVHSGLDFCRKLREEMGNSLTRIVLRTGQPGYAPEQQVVRDFDINDYKIKTELTAERLQLTMITALRGYNDLMKIDAIRRGLQRIVESNDTLFRLQSFKAFISTVLNRVAGLTDHDERPGKRRTESLYCVGEGTDLVVISGSGSYLGFANRPVDQALPPEAVSMLREAQARKSSLFGDGRHAIYIKGNSATDNLIYLEKTGPLSQLDKDLVEVFSSNLSIALDNIRLHAEVDDAQSEVVSTLGEIVETRFFESTHHVGRMSEYAELLAQKLGLPERECHLVGRAAQLHDIGKICIPDTILHKPGKLTLAEWDLMKTHAELGYEMLRHSTTQVMVTGALIARSHHEYWDGKGYPQGLKGAQIPLYGRIAAVADAFDVMGHSRCYDKAWPLENILTHLRDESGRKFDPEIVEALIRNIGEFEAIRLRYEPAEGS